MIRLTLTLGPIGPLQMEEIQKEIACGRMYYCHVADVTIADPPPKFPKTKHFAASEPLNFYRLWSEIKYPFIYHLKGPEKQIVVQARHSAFIEGFEAAKAEHGIDCSCTMIMGPIVKRQVKLSYNPDAVRKGRLGCDDHCTRTDTTEAFEADDEMLAAIGAVFEMVKGRFAMDILNIGEQGRVRCHRFSDTISGSCFVDDYEMEDGEDSPTLCSRKVTIKHKGNSATYGFNTDSFIKGITTAQQILGCELTYTIDA